MIETQARVMRIDAGVAWVTPDSPASCGACGGKGCGASLYAKLLRPTEPEYAVANPIAAVPGETVVVGIEDGDLFRAALAAYLVPLIMLLIGAMLGARWGEWQAVVLAVAGLLLALVWLRGRDRGRRQPRILRRGTIVCGTRQSPSHRS
jgi:sigma-E factor negative regulatory protein RseC